MNLRRAIASAALVLLVAATPASAEVLGKEGGFTYVKKEAKLPNGPGPKDASAIAICPAGSVDTGGGASVTGKPAGTAISASGAVVPTQWSVEGWHTGINPKNETLTAYAICTEKTAKTSSFTHIEPVGAGPAGMNATSNCPIGHAVGGGVHFSSSGSEWWLNSTSGVDAGDVDELPDDGWVAWVEHLTGPPANMFVDTICMEGKLPVYREKAKETKKKQAKVRALCPDGKSVTGGGAFASLATDDAHVVASNPIDSKKDADSVPDDGWKAKYHNAATEKQRFTASVVCR